MNLVRGSLTGGEGGAGGGEIEPSDGPDKKRSHGGNSRDRLGGAERDGRQRGEQFNGKVEVLLRRGELMEKV